MMNTDKKETRHIRPRVRKSAASKQGAASGVAANQTLRQDEKYVEEVRVKLDQWMGLDEKRLAVGISSSQKIAGKHSQPRSNNNTSNTSTACSTSLQIDQNIPEEHAASDAKSKCLKSILKTPKYSSKVLEETQTSVPSQPTTRTKESIFKQNQIVERDPSAIAKNNSTINATRATSATAVEGYQLLLDHNKRISKQKSAAETIETSDPEYMNGIDKSDSNNRTRGNEPLIFNSLADMMQAAGTLPPQDLKDNPQVVEADLSFACMSPEEYRQQLILQGMEEQEALREQADASKKPEWKENTSSSVLPTSMEGYTGANPVSDDEDQGEDEISEGSGTGGLFDFMGDDDESEEEDVIEPPRAFRILWECMSPLITYESVLFLRRLQKEPDVNLYMAMPQSDIEASRCNGFMTMIRMYISRSLKELQQPADMRRTAEQRLQGLLFTFNFSRPAAKLDTKLWKALTCVLLEMVLFLDGTEGMKNPTNYGSQLPASVQAVEMTAVEYQYLVHKTVRTLDTPDPVI